MVSRNVHLDWLCDRNKKLLASSSVYIFFYMYLLNKIFKLSYYFLAISNYFFLREGNIGRPGGFSSSSFGFYIAIIGLPTTCPSTVSFAFRFEWDVNHGNTCNHHKRRDFNLRAESPCFFPSVLRARKRNSRILTSIDEVRAEKKRKKRNCRLPNMLIRADWLYIVLYI